MALTSLPRPNLERRVPGWYAPSTSCPSAREASRRECGMASSHPVEHRASNPRPGDPTPRHGGRIVSPSRVPEGQRRGFIVPIGGAEDKLGDEAILKRF